LLSAFTPCGSPPGSWPIVSQGRLGMISHSRSYGILRCDLYYHRRLWPWLKKSVGTRLAFDGADVAIIIVRGVDEHPLEQEHLRQCNTRPNATENEPSHQSSVQYIFHIVCIGKHEHMFSSVFWYEFLCTYFDMLYAMQWLHARLWWRATVHFKLLAAFCHVVCTFQSQHSLSRKLEHPNPLLLSSAAARVGRADLVGSIRLACWPVQLSVAKRDNCTFLSHEQTGESVAGIAKQGLE
jgi:hypothetical protein